MATVETVVNPSPAQQFLDQGADFIKQHQLREAERSFSQAADMQPILARNVADYYDQLGDSTRDQGEARGYHYTAKEFYKRLLAAPPAGPYDPSVFRADVDCRIGQQYVKASSLNKYAFNAHETQRAIDYFNDAISTLGEAKMEAAYEGRFLARVKQLGHNSLRPAFNRTRKHDPQVMRLALQDLATLGDLPVTDGRQLIERFATAGVVFGYPMDEACEKLVLEQIIPQMAAYLAQPPPNNTHALVQNAVLRAFESLAQTHGWSVPQIANELGEFTRRGQLQYHQYAPLCACYKALAAGDKTYAGNASPNLELLRKECAGLPRPLQGVLSLCNTFICLFDGVSGEQAPIEAIEVSARIGMQTDNQDLIYGAIQNLLYVLDTYPDLVDQAMKGLVSMVKAHRLPKRPHGTYVRETIKLHLLRRERLKYLEDAIHRALFECLEGDADEIMSHDKVGFETASAPALAPAH